ncbi:MAG: ABC transporter permease [Candidatus Binataceae bacterium]
MSRTELDPPTVANRASDAVPPSVLTIESGGKWNFINLGELWRYRDLFYFLVWRDVKVRYQQTVLGAAWAVLQPFLTMVVFTVFFGRLAGVPSDGVPYPVFSFAALLPWMFFSNAVTSSSNSLVGNASLITKVYFPRIVIPGAAVGAGLVDFAIAAVILFGMIAWYGIALTWSALMLIPLVILTALCAVGVGMWSSALNVKYRDVRYALPFLIQIWLYVTPVIYSPSFVPARWRWILKINPLTGIIENFRAALLSGARGFKGAFNWNDLGFSCALIAAVIIYAAFAFRRMEREFADVV